METSEILISKFTQLPDYIQKDILGVVEKIYKDYKKTIQISEDEEISDDLKKLLLQRSEDSKNKPETRYTWEQLKQSVLNKYEKV